MSAHAGRTASLIAAVAAAASLAAPTAAAAQSGAPASGTGGRTSMAALIAEGYEIKAAAPNGSRYVVFLQKGARGFACEFVTVTNARCGEIQ